MNIFQKKIKNICFYCFGTEYIKEKNIKNFMSFIKHKYGANNIEYNKINVYDNMGILRIIYCEEDKKREVIVVRTAEISYLKRE